MAAVSGEPTSSRIYDAGHNSLKFQQGHQPGYGWRWIPKRIAILAPLFPKWATQELQIQGISEATIRAARRWRGVGFRSYIDTQLSDAMRISRLVATASNSDSADEANTTVRIAAGESLRKRPRLFPGGEISGRQGASF